MSTRLTQLVTILMLSASSLGDMLTLFCSVTDLSQLAPPACLLEWTRRCTEDIVEVQTKIGNQEQGSVG